MHNGRPYYPGPDPRFWIVAGIAIVLIIFGCRAHGAGVDQVARWKSAQLRSQDLMRLDKCITLFKRTESRYRVISKMRKNGAPAAVLFCLHYRESDNDFRTHAHNGDPLAHRTRNDPAGRIPGVPPPYTFEQSAEDGYYVCDKLQLTNWSSIQSALDRTERFNGYGYRALGIDAPYNWSGTNLYQRGKYVRDHVFSKTAVDAQLGVAAILLRMRDRGIPLPFVLRPPIPEKPQPPAPRSHWFQFWK
jgi:lysozyme family protein